MMRIPPHLMRRTMLRGGVWGIPVTTSTGCAAMQQSLSIIENTNNCLDDYGGTYRHRWSASAAHPVRMFSSVPIDKQMQASEEGSSPDGMDARQFLIKVCVIVIVFNIIKIEISLILVYATWYRWMFICSELHCSEVDKAIPCANSEKQGNIWLLFIDMIRNIKTRGFMTKRVVAFFFLEIWHWFSRTQNTPS